VPQVSLRRARHPAPQGFEDFFRESYRELVGRAMLAGATIEEARDAASETLTEMLLIWPLPGSPLAYARRAVVSNFIQAKTRGPGRLLDRLVERGHAVREQGVEDGGLSVFEHDSWVEDVLSELPDGLRAVMRCIAEGLDREEIANRLGISRAAVRRRICDARARLVEILSPDGEFRQPRPSAARSSREESQ
jgi:DNA-directed RNA polymerase specialized sigma24 family protein